MRISDWSSDVCSSDRISSLRNGGGNFVRGRSERSGALTKNDRPRVSRSRTLLGYRCDLLRGFPPLGPGPHGGGDRSAERRAGKECVSKCSSRWSTSHEKKTTLSRHVHKREVFT